MPSILIDNSNLVSQQPAPGAELQYLQDGTIAGSCEFTSRLGTAGSGTTIGNPHPYNSNAFCAESKVTYNESEAKIFSRYTGVWSSAVQKVTTISGAAAAPITQCPNFNDPDAPDGALVNYAAFDANGQFGGFAPKADATGPSGTGPGSGLLGLPPGSGTAYPTGADPYRLAGITGFLQGMCTLRISYSSADSSTVISAMAKKGIILNSLVAGQISYSFDYYAFLCTSVTYEETPFGTDFAQWSITEEYAFFPDPGLDPAIYG